MTAQQRNHAISKATKALNIKLKLESPFKRELRSYFYRQYKRVLRGEDIESITLVLDKHYKRIVRELTGIRLKQEEEYGLEDAILLLLFNRSTTQAGYIDATTQKKLTDALDLARRTLLEEGIANPTQKTLIRTAANIFRSYNNGRISNIATTETQSLTEDIYNTKTTIASEMMNDAISDRDEELAFEAAALAESLTYEEIAKDIYNPFAAELYFAARTMEKTWVTMQDNKVRESHEMANFQTVPISQPYIVGGYSLMYPGDTSMGAPLKEVSGCRCHSVNL